MEYYLFVVWPDSLFLHPLLNCIETARHAEQQSHSSGFHSETCRSIYACCILEQNVFEDSSSHLLTQDISNIKETLRQD